MSTPAFLPFSKIPRLFRNIVITEKIDGTNAQIFIGDSGEFFAGSRNRWLTPEADNFGFARWALEHKDELLKLGPGHHFGEWFGSGIQRGYGLKERRFALFNVQRWVDTRLDPFALRDEKQDSCPACCTVVPILYRGPFDLQNVNLVMQSLALCGSFLVPGFKNPEGVVIYHTASKTLFKKTIEGDESPKTLPELTNGK